MIVGCNRTTATGVERRDGEFEYEYSLQGDGTVPIALARLAGARHSSSIVATATCPFPRVSSRARSTAEIRRYAAFHRRAAAEERRVTRLRDTELRQQYLGKVDWAHMSAEERRLFLDTLNEAPQRLRA